MVKGVPENMKLFDFVNLQRVLIIGDLLNLMLTFSRFFRVNTYFVDIFLENIYYFTSFDIFPPQHPPPPPDFPRFPNYILNKDMQGVSVN